MTTQIYKWRVSVELLEQLNIAAKRLNVSVDDVLEMAAREWLARTTAGENDA